MWRFIIGAMACASIFSFAATAAHAAETTFSTSQTVANTVAGTNDQAATTSTTTANVAEVKASRTLTVNAVPADTETITVGSCVITFNAVAGATTDETSCADNAASVDIDTGAGDVARTATSITAVLITLTNATSTGHGSITAAASSTGSTSVVFTTTNTETSATAIGFTDGTGGDITSVFSVTGVVPVVQINTLTVSGTVDSGDVFSAVLPTVGTVSYTVASDVSSTTNIASGLVAAIQASSGYSSQAFTAASAFNVVTFTAKVAGTGYIMQNPTATNRSAVAQTVTFTPANVDIGDVFSVVINSREYTFTATAATVQNVVEGLNTALAAEGTVTCSEDNAVLTCASITAGVALTYSASVANVSSGSSRSGGGGGGGSKKKTEATPSQNESKPTAPSKPPATIPTVANNTVFTRTLTSGVTGDDVRALQERLMQEGVYTGPVTGYFGPLTMAAVKAFQAKHGIDQLGIVGPATRAKLNGGTQAATNVPVPPATPSAPAN
jgi:hypothetical protein